jgi:nucleoside 2-deoxyribosyltransferase
MKIRKVYYSHPMLNYGKEQEKNDIGKIERKFGRAQIVNPADTKPQDMGNCSNEMEFFFRQIDNCDVVVFRRFGNIITSGVGQEINYALGKGKSVFEITDKGFKKVTKPVDFISRELTRELYSKELKKLW